MSLEDTPSPVEKPRRRRDDQPIESLWKWGQRAGVVLAVLASVAIWLWKTSGEVNAKATDLVQLDRRVTSLEDWRTKQPDAVNLAASIDRITHELEAQARTNLKLAKLVARLVCDKDPARCDDAMSAIGDGQ